MFSYISRKNILLFSLVCFVFPQYRLPVHSFKDIGFALVVGETKKSEADMLLPSAEEIIPFHSCIFL